MLESRHQPLHRVQAESNDAKANHGISLVHHDDTKLTEVFLKVFRPTLRLSVVKISDEVTPILGVSR
jgi:hypothetical protein